MNHRFLHSVRLSLSSVAAIGALLGCGGSAPANDAATPRDSGGPVDAAPADDVGPVDAGPVAECPMTFSGCGAIDDHTADATVSIAFSGFAYSPHCIRISPGTVVSIPGSSLHPLRSATCSPSDTPIAATPTPSNGDYTFTTPGTYGYYCNAHGTNSGGGMAGLIIVE